MFRGQVARTSLPVKQPAQRERHREYDMCRSEIQTEPDVLPGRQAAHPLGSRCPSGKSRSSAALAAWLEGSSTHSATTCRLAAGHLLRLLRLVLLLLLLLLYALQRSCYAPNVCLDHCSERSGAAEAELLIGWWKCSKLFQYNCWA